MWTQKQQKASEIFFSNEDFSKLKQPGRVWTLDWSIVWAIVVGVIVYQVAKILLNLYSFQGSY